LGIIPEFITPTKIKNKLKIVQIHVINVTLDKVMDMNIIPPSRGVQYPIRDIIHNQRSGVNLYLIIQR